jgi:PAS domain S-box-containing protein
MSDGDARPRPLAGDLAAAAFQVHDPFVSRELFKGILDIADDAIISIDQDQRIILFNQGAERLFGYQAREVVGQPLDALLPEPLRARHPHHVRQFRTQDVASRRMGERGSISARRKDGTVFPAEASISRIAIGGGTIYTAILRDVTEARRAEEQIRQLNVDLRHRADQLESANRELEAFSYSVSHDLRAPLRTITGFSQVLVEDFAERLGAEGEDYLQRIGEAGRRMAQLIDDLLELSRLTRGSIRRERVDLSALARSVADELRAAEPDRDLAFVAAEGLAADADPHLVRALLTNLLGNAWKYTGKRPSARVEFGAEDGEAGGVVFFVRDNGVGFDMAYADKLFGAFQRLHGMKEYPGTGIGLATAQRIVHKHGGEIWAEAEVGRGATFRFTLR